MNNVTVALVGNPNVGKSTVFNALTGADQHVGNWPGKTVEKRSGFMQVSARMGKSVAFSGDDTLVTIVDLPGAYSLSAYSLEEEITRNFLIEERPQLVVNVIDAANLERNLYLTVQILETGLPLILVLNMLDQVEARGVKIDAAHLSRLLCDTPVIELVARRGQGIDALRKQILATVTNCERSRAW